MTSIEMEPTDLLDICLAEKHYIPLQNERAAPIVIWLLERYGQKNGKLSICRTTTILGETGPWSYEFYWSMAARRIGPFKWWKQKFSEAVINIAMQAFKVSTKLIVYGLEIRRLGCTLNMLVGWWIYTLYYYSC